MKIITILTTTYALLLTAFVFIDQDKRNIQNYENLTSYTLKCDKNKKLYVTVLSEKKQNKRIAKMLIVNFSRTTGYLLVEMKNNLWTGTNAELQITDNSAGFKDKAGNVFKNCYVEAEMNTEGIKLF
ncbi:MAG: hypothetical protein ACTSXL_02415 [Alphaproteobacteria bacterium]